MRTWIFAALMALSGCAAQAPRQSAITASDTAALTQATVDYVATVLPVASSKVYLETAQPNSDAFTSSLSDALRSKGYAVAETPDSGAHPLSVDVLQVDGGCVLRWTVDGRNATRWFSRDATGTFAAASPVTVRITQ